jgi:FkbM family methyltransferase
MNIAQVHTHPIYGFKFVQVSGYGGHDHASAWTFQDEQIVRDRWFHIHQDEVVLDIGAAFGSYALPALAMGARVIAFSPADLDTQLLNENLKLNPELAKRCLVVRDGLYSRNGWFQPDRNEFEPAQLTDTGRHSGGWLRTRSLDSFLAARPGIDRVDWMKMDVEGAEYEVLRGAEQCLRKWKPKILVELHSFHDGATTQKVTDYLFGLGVGYFCDGPIQHCAVSHALFSVPA